MKHLVLWERRARFSPDVAMIEIIAVILGIAAWFASGILGSHIGFSKVARVESKSVWKAWKERGVIGPALGFAGPATIYAALTLEKEK